MSQTLGNYMPARYYANFCDWMTTIGVDVDKLLSDVEIPREVLYGPKVELDLTQIEALVQRAMIVTGRADLGFDWGRQIKLSSHDILGYAFISSPNLDYALRLAARFYRLMITTFRLSYSRTANGVELNFSPASAMRPEVLRFHIEGIAISVHEQFKMLLGDAVQPYEYYGSNERPAHHERYRLFAPARWHFEALPMPGIRIVIPASMADCPLRMADRNALQMAEERCEALHSHIVQSGELGNWIAMMLREAHDSMPTLDDFATILHVTSRTLDRRLRKEGRQFKEITMAVRFEKACMLLSENRHSVTEIAYLLGYKDVANFTRAFKRDSGVSPTQYQDKQRNENAAPAS